MKGVFWSRTCLWSSCGFRFGLVHGFYLLLWYLRFWGCIVDTKERDISSGGCKSRKKN